MTDALRRFARTALYQRNLPLLDRLLRTAGALALLIASALFPLPGWMKGLMLGTAAFVLVTAFVGFCPACHFLKLRPSVPRRP